VTFQDGITNIKEANEEETLDDEKYALMKFQADNLMEFLDNAIKGTTVSSVPLRLFKEVLDKPEDNRLESKAFRPNWHTFNYNHPEKSLNDEQIIILKTILSICK